MIQRLAIALALFFSLTTVSFAQLKPAEIVVVAAQGSRESEALAKYYCKVRNVPAENLCLVDLPRGETIPYDTWRWGIRPAIQKWLVEHDPEKKIRCLVTVWDVPLKIAPAPADPEMLKYRQFLEGERKHRLEMLSTVADALQRVAPKGELVRDDLPGEAGGAETAETTSPVVSSVAENSSGGGPTDGEAENKPEPAAGPAQAGNAPPADGSPPPVLKQTDFQRAQQRLEKALQGAQARSTTLAKGDLQKQAQNQIQQLATAAGGANVLVQGLSQQLGSSANVPPAARSEFDSLRGRTMAYAEVKLLLDQTAPSIERDALVLAILERATGILGTVQWLDEQLNVVAQNETGASFDSELSLVMWPEDYQLLRWQPNYLRPAFENSQLPKAYRTLMVSRIDAPTLPLAKGLIDTAIKMEQEGLRGTVYIDARGLTTIDANAAPGTYEDYDRALLITAKGIEEQTDLKVVLETTPQLFQPGQCADAAVYCGWYSLAHYIDAFEWKPGAVAYHLASSEASTLRDPGSQVWCKKLLEDGVCATIGPVYEPYLGAFPRPNEFLALLISGQLTLAECYSRSLPFNSWMMVLVGDPLYRPFKYRFDAAQLEASRATVKPAASNSQGSPTTASPTPPAPAKAPPTSSSALPPAAPPK